MNLKGIFVVAAAFVALVTVSSCSSKKSADETPAGAAVAVNEAAVPAEGNPDMKKPEVAPGVFVPSAVMPRKDVPQDHLWNLDYMYQSEQAWEASYLKTDAALKSIDAVSKTCTIDAASMKTCLETTFDIRKEIESLSVYAYAFYSTDRNSADIKARLDRVQALETRFAEVSAFVEPALLAMDPQALVAMVAGDAGLSKYKHFVDDLIRRRPHVLPEAQEKLLAMTGDLQAGPGFMHGALEADVKFPDVTGEDGKPQSLTMASFTKFRNSSNREVRKEAVTKFFETLKGYSKSFAASLDMAVKRDILNSKARIYSSSLESSLDGNAVPVDVFKTLIKTTHDNLPKTLHKYVQLRRKVLKLQEVNYYDLYVPLFPKSEKMVTYAEGVELTKAALVKMGPEYNETLTTGLDVKNGWVDVYPCDGKRSGAFCNGAWRQHPMVFLNFQNELEDVFTLAHEFGHALHFHLAGKNQEFINADTPIFLAEIASTFNEEMLLDYLVQRAETKQEKLYLLNKRIENIRTTVFRQTMFAEFEYAIHQEVENGGALTAEKLAEIYGGLIREYYGPDFTIGKDDGWEWAYIPHFYYNYYVFQYATGLMSAIALSKNVRDGGEPELQRYLDFLRAGNSDYPVDTLKKAGVDLTNSAAMQATFDIFAATIDEIEKLMDDQTGV
jgi:oligoendopeptidase F